YESHPLGLHTNAGRASFARTRKSHPERCNDLGDHSAGARRRLGRSQRRRRPGVQSADRKTKKSMEADAKLPNTPLPPSMGSSTLGISPGGRVEPPCCTL